MCNAQNEGSGRYAKTGPAPAAHRAHGGRHRDTEMQQHGERKTESTGGRCLPQAMARNGKKKKQNRRGRAIRRRTMSRITIIKRQKLLK